MRIRSGTLSLLTLSAAIAATTLAAEKPAKKPADLVAARVNDPVAGLSEKLYERVTPSFVAVKFTWDFELRRQDLIGPGVVVGDDGLIMCPIGVFNPFFADVQMKDFKVVIPSQEKDADEIEAEFVGRDERTNVAFLRPKKNDGKSEKPDKPEPANKEKKDDKKDDKKDG